MFQAKIAPDILEVSHKRIDRPTQSVYYNHIHNHCELLLFISGKANYNIDGQLYTPSPFDLIFIPSATYHYLIPTEAIPYENYVIGIAPSFISQEHYRTLFTSRLMINIKDDPQLLGFFQRLDEYHEQYSEEDFNRCSIYLIQELITYCHYHKPMLTSDRVGALPYVDSIIRYINENLDLPLDADMLSKQFSLSKSYIQNMFTQHMHIGLKKFIMLKKIYSAHADLSRGLNPTDVCAKYAFGDYSSFYRLYKSTFGLPPGRRTKGYEVSI